MNIRRGSKIYTRVGDFDPPTHQPTSNYIRVELNIIIIIMLIAQVHKGGGAEGV